MTTTEKAWAQSHFLDVCAMVGEPGPMEADPTGEHYAFERRVEKAGGGDGFADVWKRGFFAWEYKGPRKDLMCSHPNRQIDRGDSLGGRFSANTHLQFATRAYNGGHNSHYRKSKSPLGRDAREPEGTWDDA